jgi:hypothetical protein
VIAAQQHRQPAVVTAGPSSSSTSAASSSLTAPLDGKQYIGEDGVFAGLSNDHYPFGSFDAVLNAGDSMGMPIQPTFQTESGPELHSGSTSTAQAYAASKANRYAKQAAADRIQRKAEEPPKTARPDLRKLEHLQANVSSLAARLQQLETSRLGSASAATTPSVDSCKVTLSIPAIAPSVRQDGAKTRVWGPNHWRHFLDNRFSLFGRLQSKDENHVPYSGANSDIVALVEDCRGLRRQIKESSRLMAFESSRDLLLGPLPSKDVCVGLVHAYLDTYELLHRVLHIPTFWAEFERYWPNLALAPLCARAKILLVLAIGSAFKSPIGGVELVRSALPHWVYTLQCWIGSPSERIPWNVDGLQVRCLLVIACHANSMGSRVSRWMSAGSLMRFACSLGLHRDPSHYRELSEHDRELRRRLWTTVRELDLQMAVESNMPYETAEQSFDCVQPADVSDEDMADSTLSSSSNDAPSGFTQTSLQVFLLRYLPLRINVARHINAARDEISYDDALKLGQELLSMRRDVLNFFDVQLRDAESPFSAFHARYLDAMVSKYLLLLHRPFAVRAMRDPRFYFSRKICTETGITLLRPVAEGRGYFEPPDDSMSLPLGSIGSASTAACFDAITYLCLELITQLDEQGPMAQLGTGFGRDMTQDAREPILSTLRRIRDRLLGAIAEGDPSLKRYIFLASALSQIEAIAAGRPAEDALTKTLKTSLECCRDLLQRHTPTTQMSDMAAFTDTMGGDFSDFSALGEIEAWVQNSMVSQIAALASPLHTIDG